MSSPLVGRKQFASEDRLANGGKSAQVLPFKASGQDGESAFSLATAGGFSLSDFKFNDTGSDRRLADYLVIGVLSIFIHTVVVEYFKKSDVEPIEIEKPVKVPSKVQISFVKPQPPKVIQPPPPPKVVAINKPPKPKIKPKPQPVIEQPPAPPNAVVAEVATPAPPAPAPPPVEKVTEPRGGAGYLDNPSPVYPEIAMDRGWEGKVMLKVHVLASGQPDSVAVLKTSGQKVLDDEAVRTVKKWSFAPATRGKTPIDGWVTVPINFKL